MFQNNHILLVKEKEDGGWTLPGGWADIGQSPAEFVVREVYEESSFQTRPVKLIAVYDRNKHPHPPYPIMSTDCFFIANYWEVPPQRALKLQKSAFLPKMPFQNYPQPG